MTPRKRDRATGRNPVPRALALALGIFVGLTLPAFAQEEDDDPNTPCIEAAEAQDWDAVVSICPPLLDQETDDEEVVGMIQDNVNYAYQALCTSAAQASDWDKTLMACGPALEAYPEFFSFHLFLGLANESKENLEGATGAYRAFLAGADESPGMAAQLGQQIALAERNTALLLLRMEDREAAIPYLRRVLERDPEDAEMHFRLGFALLQGGDTEGAEEEFSTVIEQAPDIPQLGQVTFLAGQINYNAERYEKAASQLGRYVDLYPDGEQTVEAHWMLGSMAARSSDDNAAVTHFRAFLEAAPSGDPRAALANYSLGTIAFGRNQCDTAQTYYRRFLRLAPNDPQAAQVNEILLDIEDGLCEPG